MSGQISGAPQPLQYTTSCPLDSVSQSHTPSEKGGPYWWPGALHATHSSTGAILTFSLYASLRVAVLGETAQWIKYLSSYPEV